MVSISALATKALRGAQRLAKNSKGIRKLGPAKLDLDTLFDDALRNRVGHHLTELAEQTIGGLHHGASAAATREMMRVFASRQFPDHLVPMLKSAYPDDLARFALDMATVFVRPNLSSHDMLKIPPPGF
jgi:hypothetical protein